MTNTPKAHEHTRPRPSLAPRTLHVLVVDDDDGSRAGMELAVRDLGHRCSTATDGVEAFDIVVRDRPDMILSDLMMPRMDGLELCRRVRDLPGEYIYFVFTSAMHDKAHVLQGLESGADDYLGKPIDLDELEARVRAASRLLLVQKQVTEQNALLRRDSQQLFAVSRIDALTQCKNRRALDEDLAAVTANAARYEQAWALGMIDIDDFKKFNDAFGHPAGDEALQRVTEAVALSLRRGDTLFRYGGEEFVVLLAEQDEIGTRAALERARRAVEKLDIEHAPGATHRRLTISAGGSVLRAGTTPDSWLTEADTALYRAKRAGKNAVVI
jgi:two-component system, cell cycle response regulator